MTYSAPNQVVTCSATHSVTDGSGFDVGTCWRPVHGDELDHDYQVEPPTVVRPWHPGDGRPAGTEVLRDGPERRGDPAEEVVLDCGFCPYGIDFHVLTPGGLVCPTEDQARAAAGDR